MSNVTGFKCFECSREFNAAEICYACPACGGNLDALYDYDRIGARLTKLALASDRNFTIWRYSELLPIENSSLLPPLSVKRCSIQSVLVSLISGWLLLLTALCKRCRSVSCRLHQAPCWRIMRLSVCLRPRYWYCSGVS